MDLKQALQQRGSYNNSSSNNNKGSAANSIQSSDGGGNNSSCSNSTNTGESNRGSPVAAPLLSSAGPLLTNRISPVSHNNIHRPPPPPPCELAEAAHDHRLLKLAHLHDDPPSPHSTLETQALINLNGNYHNSSSTTTTTTTTHTPSPYLTHSTHNSNHASPTCTLLNGGSLSSPSPASHSSKFYPFATLDDPRHHSPFMLSSSPAAQAALLSSARAHHGSLPCFNPEPVVSLFTPEQLLEFTQQTFVFKHFAAGVTPPPTLLLPIINSVAALARMGGGSMHFGSNAGLFGVGGLRGNVDPEPGRCRRTDGKKWRCAREVVADQKYCERHMHRGRHRARANNKLASAGTDGLNATSNLPTNTTPSSANAHASNGVSVNTSTSFAVAPKEPHLQFSLQTASAVATQLHRTNNNNNSANDKQALLSDPAGGLKRLLEGNNIGRTLAAQPDEPPNLAGLLKVNSSAKSSYLPKSQIMGLESTTFPFTCQNSDRDADNLALRQFVGGDHWPRLSRAAENPPPSNLSWFDQLAEEQNKRSRFNTELSIATQHKSPLNLSAKFGGGDHQEDMLGVDQSHYMGLSMAVGAKVGGSAKEEDRYSSRSSWVPIAWENPTIGGPLGEVLQSNGANSSGNYSGNLANNGEGCLNLIEEESWEKYSEGRNVRSPAKDSHSPSLASPTGVLQMKSSFASYSDSSSSASSPRSALKLDSANLGI